MVKATFAYQKTGTVNNQANVAFTIFAQNFLLSFLNFTTYLPGANLWKSIFLNTFYNFLLAKQNQFDIFISNNQFI